jgi:hypothetical protein
VIPYVLVIATGSADHTRKFRILKAQPSGGDCLDRALLIFGGVRRGIAQPDSNAIE